MLRIGSIIACLSVSAACFAIGPASFPSQGPVTNDATNSEFLAAVNNFSTKYYNYSNADAGASFSFAHGMPSTIPGYGGNVGVRIWFVSQDAGYTNALGVKLGGTDSILFADSHALTFGDHVDINGGAVVGPAMHFFALADIVGGNASYLWQGPKGLNSDNQEHLQVSWKAKFFNAGSLWYALALDDQMGGGDRDWNDLRVLVQLHPVVTPEPGTIALFLGFAAMAAWLWRRQSAILA